MKNNTLKTLMIVGIAGCASSSLAGIVAETHWNSGTLEGWTYSMGTGGGEYETPLVGGNGGGYIQYVDGLDGSLPVPRLFAPAEFLGDYTSYEGGYIEYDIILAVPGTPSNYQRMRLEGANGSEARIIMDYTVTQSWQTVHVNIVEAEWEMVSGTWADLMSNVTAMRLGGDLLIGSGPEGGIDNVILVPEAPFAGLVTLGLAGLVRRRR